MPYLVEGPSAVGGLFEEFGGCFVGEPCPSGGRAQVPYGGCEAWFSVGEEHRPAGAAAKVSAGLLLTAGAKATLEGALSYRYAARAVPPSMKVHLD